VAAGTFREDLLFRLHTLKLTLPPLRDRRGDILLLARYLLARAAEVDHKPVPEISESAARALEAYTWPGNVRELQAKMHHALVVSMGGIVRVEDLIPAFRAIDEDRTPSLAEAMAAFERAYVSQALSECRGHRVRTAARLGITRQGLSQMMKRLGMTGDAA
jgi:DNA-binding NtrC family response regulator